MTVLLFNMWKEIEIALTFLWTNNEKQYMYQYIDTLFRVGVLFNSDFPS